MKKLNLVITLIVLSLYSCDTNEGEVTMSPEDAKVTMATMGDEMESDLVEMVNNSGTDALTNLLDLVSVSDPFAGRLDPNATSKVLMKQRLKSVKNVFVSESVGVTQEDGAFDFQSKLGVYDYNPTTGLWDLVVEGGDYFIINFPSEGSTTNNATLRITEYAEIKVIEDVGGWVETYYYPTSIACDLTIDEEVEVVFTMSASYTEEGNPLTVAIDLDLAGYRYTLTFSDTEPTSSSIAFSIWNGPVKIIGSSVTVTFQSESKEMASYIDGEVSYRTIAIRGNVDITSINEMEQETIAINDLVNVAIYNGASKMGDIVFDEVVGEEYLEVYIEYADGSRDLLEDFLAPVIDEMEAFLLEIEGV